MQLRNLKALINEDDAVSPVIGVVLMVAITVILAAVIGAFVIGLGSETSATPAASFEWDYSGSTLSVVHDGGDTLTASNVVIKESDTTNTLTKQITGTSEVTAGDELASGTYDSGETIKIVYNSPDSDKTAVLSSSTAP